MVRLNKGQCVAIIKKVRDTLHTLSPEAYVGEVKDLDDVLSTLELITFDHN